MTDEAAARSDATRLLAAVELPAGAMRSSTEPAGGGRWLAAPASYPATPNLVDNHKWWIVPGSAGAVLAYLNSHAPAGSKLTGTSISNGPNIPTVQSVEFDWPARPNVLSQRALVIEVTDLSNDTAGVRADAEEVWVTPRAMTDRIPADVSTLTVTLTRFGSLKQGPYDFRSARKVAAVRRIINGLPAAQPGTRSCPGDLGFDIALRFYDARSNEVATTDIDTSGCGGATLTLGGRRQHALGEAVPPSKRSVSDAVQRTLGLHLHT
jgi:hypothetical protein